MGNPIIQGSYNVGSIIVGSHNGGIPHYTLPIIPSPLYSPINIHIVCRGKPNVLVGNGTMGRGSDAPWGV